MTLTLVRQLREIGQWKLKRFGASDLMPPELTAADRIEDLEAAVKMLRLALAPFAAWGPYIPEPPFEDEPDSTPLIADRFIAARAAWNKSMLFDKD